MDNLDKILRRLDDLKVHADKTLYKRDKAESNMPDSIKNRKDVFDYLMIAEDCSYAQGYVGGIEYTLKYLGLL